LHPLETNDEMRPLARPHHHDAPPPDPTKIAIQARTLTNFWLRLRPQMECDDRVTGAPRAAAARRDRHKLIAGCETIRHRRRFAALGQVAAPQLASVLNVEGVQSPV
jgi:hypothetical protein